MKPLRPLALLGGTFDPVHLGHLRAAWEASEALDADVRVVPLNIPPHRPAPIASPAQRLAMLRAALAGQHRLALDMRELARPGPSYTRDTLVSLRHDVGSLQPLVWLIGADAFAALATWHRWRELFELAHFGVLTRPGHIPPFPPELAEALAGREVAGARTLRESPAGGVLRIAITPLGISATRIRTLLREGREPRWLLPDAVLTDRALLAPYRQSQDSSPGV